MDESEFVEFLKKKNIDAERFRSGDSEIYAEWLLLFSQTHPKSFTAQKLYQINALRRKYILNDKNQASKSAQMPENE
jgi:hypothetical protein